MIEVVINYDPTRDEFKVYEPTTDTILVSKTLSEALVNLSSFLVGSQLTQADILNCSDISYHFDSETMKRMVESNVNLMKRLNSAPSGFTLSSQRFGTSTLSQSTQRNRNNNGGGGSNNNYSNSKSAEKRRYKLSGNNFSGKNGFSSAMKKFGNKY